MLSSDRVADARRAIHQHLVQADVYTSIRQILSAHAADHADFNPNDPDQVMRVLKERGIVNQILGDVNVTVSEPVANNKITPTDRAIHVRLSGGRAFLDMFDTASREFLAVHVQFGDQRLRSARVAAAVDPLFDDDFVLRLAPSLRDVVEDDTPLHLLVTAEDGNGCRSRIVGENVVQWRRALRTGALNLAVELAGVNPGVPAGILDIQIEVIPHGVRKSDDEINYHIEQTHHNMIACDREFLVYARRWWAEFHSVAPASNKAGVKIFAPSNGGRMLPVTHFIDAVPPEREFESPVHAARFVALFGLDSPTDDADNGVLSGVRTGPGEQWLQSFSFLAQRRGDAPNHGLLLCSLFIGMGLEAYCAIVTDNANQASVVVVTKHSTGPLIWLPTTGRHEPWAQASELGIVALGCVFSDAEFYANLQTVALDVISFDFSDDTKWKELNPLKLRLVPRIRPPPLLWIPVNVRQLEIELEGKLRNVILDHRDRLSLPTRWDEALSSVLAMGLAAYEASSRSGDTPQLNFFHDAVRGKIGAGRSFKGFPINVTHTNEKRVLISVLGSGTGKGVVECSADDCALALRVKIFSFPERVLSVWIMIASRSQTRI